MNKNEIEQRREEASQSTTAWMLTLSLARDSGDVDRVAVASAELARRGVEVRFTSTERRAKERERNG